MLRCPRVGIPFPHIAQQQQCILCRYGQWNGPARVFVDTRQYSIQHGRTLLCTARPRRHQNVGRKTCQITCLADRRRRDWLRLHELVHVLEGHAELYLHHRKRLLVAESWDTVLRGHGQRRRRNTAPRPGLDSTAKWCCFL